MVTPTTPDTTWKVVLRRQGRSIRWLAEATGASPRAVYSYSTHADDPTHGNARKPPMAWLARVSDVLGEEVTG